MLPPQKASIDPTEFERTTESLFRQPLAGSPLALVSGMGPDSDATTQSLIMLIDDEPTTTDVLQIFLEENGYRNLVATNDARQALALMADTRPDLVLLDLMMPEVGGFDILGAMREDEALEHTPVIILTSAQDSDTKLSALRLGASDFLAKPVDPSELVLRLRNTLRAKAQQDRLRNFDSVTGLPNRAQLERKLRESLALVAGNGNYSALMHIDLDRFRKINDSLGRAAGDLMLKAVAQRLESALFLGEVTLDYLPQADPFVARLGGDEFAILLPDLRRLEQVMYFAGQVRSAFGQVFKLAREELFVSASIGIAVSPQDGTEVETLLHKASAATAHVKDRGLRAPHFFDSTLNAHSRERLRLETLLYQAMETDQMQLAFQPKICVPTGRVIGAEALLRWQLPDGVMVSPAEFIPLAEETGLIVVIGAGVLRHACQQLRHWAARGCADLGLSVNVSAAQFREPGFLGLLRDALQEGGFEPGRLTLELTEGLLIENVSESERLLREIRTLGAKVSIDDFGMGYSSLGYLKRFAVDELKIDRGFIRGLPDNVYDSAIVDTVIHLARNLGLKVVAEGVERTDQLAYLATHGCQEFQGFLACKAVPAPAFLRFVDEYRGSGWRPPRVASGQSPARV